VVFKELIGEISVGIMQFDTIETSLFAITRCLRILVDNGTGVIDCGGSNVSWLPR
jgi:hypothetical protein